MTAAPHIYDEEIVTILERAGVPTFTARRALTAMEQRRRTARSRYVSLGVLYAMPVAIIDGEVAYTRTDKCTAAVLADAVQVVSDLYLKRKATKEYLLRVLFTAATLIPHIEAGHELTWAAPTN